MYCPGRTKTIHYQECEISTSVLRQKVCENTVSISQTFVYKAVAAVISNQTNLVLFTTNVGGKAVQDICATCGNFPPPLLLKTPLIRSDLLFTFKCPELTCSKRLVSCSHQGYLNWPSVLKFHTLQATLPIQDAHIWKHLHSRSFLSLKYYVHLTSVDYISYWKFLIRYCLVDGEHQKNLWKNCAIGFDKILPNLLPLDTKIAINNPQVPVIRVYEI